MLFVEGVAHRLEGRPDEAETVLARALDVAMAFDADPQAALTLVEQGGIAADRGDWTEAVRTADEALALVGDGTYDEYWSSAVVFAWAARMAAHRGEVPAARGSARPGHPPPTAPQLRAPGDVRSHPRRDGSCVRRDR